MIDAHHAAAKASGARILHSCGFDSIPFELGVYFCQETAKAKLGGAGPAGEGPGARHAGRALRRHGGQRGGDHGGDPEGPVADGDHDEPVRPDARASRARRSRPACAAEDDPDVGADVGPFMMAVINTKNVHRSNLLMGHPLRQGLRLRRDGRWPGRARRPGSPTWAACRAAGRSRARGRPRKSARRASTTSLFIGIAADGRQVRVSVKGDKDPGYGSTSKMLAETAIALVSAPTSGRRLDPGRGAAGPAGGAAAAATRG